MSKGTQALIQCPHCLSASEYNCWVSANVTVSPHLRQEVLSESLFWKECKNCHEGFNVNHDLLYHDMEKQFCVWLKYENAAGEIEFEPGAERAGQVFNGYWLRIVFDREELIEKIKIDRDGYDDIFIETIKLFHSLKNEIDLATPFYYDRTTQRKTRKTLVFLSEPKEAESVEHTLDLNGVKGVVDSYVPQISAALESDWPPWMSVTRREILLAMERCGLASRIGSVEREEGPSAELIEKAEILVTMATSIAIASLTSAEQNLELPETITEDVENWNFFVTVAGVFAALYTLGKKVSDRIFETVGITVFENLADWNPQGSGAFADCQQFVENSLNSARDEQIELTAADAIGMWLLCNLYGRFPSPEESAAARPLGGFLLDTFAEWWVEGN